MKTIAYRLALAVAAFASCSAPATEASGVTMDTAQKQCDLSIQAAPVVTKDPYTFIYHVTHRGEDRCIAVVRIPGAGTFLDRGLAFPVAQTPSCMPGDQAATHFYCKTELTPNAAGVFVITAGAFPRSSGYVCLDATVRAERGDVTPNDNVDVACYDPTPPQVCPGPGAFTERVLQ